MSTALEVNIFQESLPIDIRGNALEIRKGVKEMLVAVEGLVVNDDASYNHLTSLYRQARQWQKTIEARRKEMTEPFRRQEAAINDKIKELMLPLGQVIALANSKVNCYMQKIEERKRKEEEKLREDAALFDVDPESIYVPEIPKSIVGNSAATTTRNEKRFRIVDLKQVPEKYLTVDEKAIKQDLKLGITEIPGLEIYEEKTTTLRVR